MTSAMMMVCPHDTVHNPDRWFRLEQYLVQHLGIELQFELSLDFADFHENVANATLAYLNPNDCLDLRSEHGFVPLVRAAGQHDEAVFVASPDVASPTLASIAGQPLVTVTSALPTRIGLHMLHEAGIHPSALLNHDNWQAVVSAIFREEAQFGILYKDSYDHLSDQGKSMAIPFATSDAQKAFHCLSVAPSLAARAADITATLTAMHTDPAGKEVLAELEVSQWVPITDEALTAMEALLHMDT